MEEIGKILPAVFRNRVRRGEPSLVRILAPLWSQVAGKPIALHSRPVAYEGGMLTLVADGSSWTVELRHMAEEIRAKVNHFLGEPAVKKLRVEHRASHDPHELRAPGLAHASDRITSKPIGPDGGARRDARFFSRVDRSFAKDPAQNGRKAH